MENQSPIHFQEAEVVSDRRHVIVFDAPTRLFHWIFTALFLAAFLIGKNADDESPLFSWHMLAGLMLGFSVILRLVWGVIGTRWATFRTFPLAPRSVVRYFSGILTGKSDSHAGHNPASAWAAIFMFALALGLAFTGIRMASGAGSETIEEIHEVLANLFLITAIAHVAGVLLHVMRKKDGLGTSMLDGKKAVDQNLGIRSAHWLVALLFLGLMSLAGWNLVQHFDAQTRTLTLFGNQLQLGEAEENGDEATGETQLDTKKNEKENGEHEGKEDDDD